MENRFKIEETECSLCHPSRTKEMFIGRDRLCKKEGQFRVVQCERCGLIYTNPRPTQETIGYFYPSDYAPYKAFYSPYIEIYNRKENLLSRIKNELKYHILTNYYGYQDSKPAYGFTYFVRLPQVVKKLLLRISYVYFKKHYYRIPFWHERGRALDLGCGNGAYLLLLKKIGWDAVGVDISDNVAKEVKEAKITIHTGELKELRLKTGSFNLITMWHVLEHLPKPLQILQEINRLLTDNGCLLIEIPNSASIVAKIFKSNWFALDLPRHFYHFSPHSLSKMLKRAGFEVVKTRHLCLNTFLKSMGYYLEDLKIKFDVEKANKNKIVFYFLKLCGNLLAFFRTSDIILVEARKR